MELHDQKWIGDLPDSLRLVYIQQLKIKNTDE
jgi:hypothetical protein